MRMDAPRIPPLAEEEWTDEVRKLLAPAQAQLTPGSDQPTIFNIFRTLAHYPGLMKRWMVFANHVLFKSSLGARERELVILRIGWLCRAGYEWGQHVGIGEAAGLTVEEIRRIKIGPVDAAWSETDRALLEATDELHRDAFISPDTWAKLTPHYSTEQLMDVVFAVGQYNLVSMALNTLGVQLDDGLKGLEHP
jgi:4-carboxymuconolactone decarboxylase